MGRQGEDATWIVSLKDGQAEAAQRLWQHYYSDLVRHAQNKLRGSSRRVADEEDVALSAINSFCKAAAAGRFPQLEDRDDLWRILLALTSRKAIRQRQSERRQKRGGGRVRGESVFVARDDFPEGRGIEQAMSSEPTPVFAAELADQMEQLLGSLPDDTLRQVAVRKMEGCTNEEVAAELGLALRSVERKLRFIREIWSEHLGEP